MGRRLERHVDFDLAERILASGPIKRKNPPKTTKKPRPAKTYRAARRNAALQARKDAKKAARQMRTAA
jgi:hypothetical protein